MNTCKTFSSFSLLSLLFIMPMGSFAAQNSFCDESAHVCLMAHNGKSTQPTLLVSQDQPVGGDLSRQGEMEYVQQIRDWLNSLPKSQQEPARKILVDAHSELQSLRKEIYNKKIELAAVRFDTQSSLEKLPKLGMELQKLRATLRAKLEEVNDRLLKEAGIKMNPLQGEGFWLQPLAKTPLLKHAPASSLDSFGMPVSMFANSYLPIN